MPQGATKVLTRSHYFYFCIILNRLVAGRIGTIGAVSGLSMKSAKNKKAWRLEVSNPVTSTDWSPLWQFADDEKAKYEELKEELNRINRPVLIRIVSNFD